MITFFNTFVVANHNKIIVFLFFRQYLGAPHESMKLRSKKCHYYMTLCEIGRRTLVRLDEIVGEITL
jgi:hypothetical protein